MDKTPPSEGGNAGSIPAEDTVKNSKLKYQSLKGIDAFLIFLS